MKKNDTEVYGRHPAHCGRVASIISGGGEATMEELNGFRFFILAGESVDTLWIDQVMLFRSADRIIRAESQTTAALTASNAAKISRNIDI